MVDDVMSETLSQAMLQQ
jgi:hypothetical protein